MKCQKVQVVSITSEAGFKDERYCISLLSIYKRKTENQHIGEAKPADV